MAVGEQVEQVEPEASQEPADDEAASPLSVNWNWGQKRRVQQNAADYGAKIGRPVSISEFVRERALEPVEAES